MANESGSDENLCFFITRIGEDGSPEREQADGVMDAIVKPAAEKRGSTALGRQLVGPTTAACPAGGPAHADALRG